jgi:peptide/nickel transport system substrate-binding protein
MAQAQLDDTETCDRNLIGTGPYVLDEWLVNDRMTADRNPGYWATDEQGNRLPYLDRIEFVPVVDSQNRVNGLLAGEYGAAMFRRAAPTEVLEAESEAGAVGVNQSVEGSQVAHLMLNHARPPFDDPQAREAVALALDRDRYREVVALGTTELASGPFPPGSPGHLDDAGFPEHDLERARELVSDYEERTGSELEFSYLHSAIAEDTQAAQFVQEQLEAAGMQVTLQPREQATLINEALGTNWQMMLVANFPGGEPDGNYVWWHSDSPVNLSRIQDAELDSLLETARSELDESAATDRYEQVNLRLNEETHYIWLNQLKWTIATEPSISGVYGPTLPSGDEPTRSLASGHPTLGLHYTQ